MTGIKNRAAGPAGPGPAAEDRSHGGDQESRQTHRGQHSYSGAGAAGKAATKKAAAASTPGASQVFAIRAADIPRLAISGIANAANAALTRLILDFVRRKIIHAKVGRGALCLSCDREFLASTEPPNTFVIALPFTEPAGTAVVSAICAACAERLGSDGALIDAAIESYRSSIFPDANIVGGGRA
jgi:hypothetical protein